MSETKERDPSRSITPQMLPGETQERTLARLSLRPEVTAAATSIEYQRGLFEGQSLDDVVRELETQCAAVQRGDLSRPEALLTAQAHTLDAIFNKLARLAAANLNEYPVWGDRYLRLAMKAQTQCRATLETLANIKNPPMVFAKQANVATGPQQINNNFESSTHARTRETQSEQNRLLEQTDGQRLDSGATGQAIGSDPAMATVGSIDRTKDGGR